LAEWKADISGPISERIAKDARGKGDQFRAIPHKVAKFAYWFWRYEAAWNQTVLVQAGSPNGILFVGLLAADSFDIFWVCQSYPAGRLKDVKDRNPILARGFHAASRAFLSLFLLPTVKLGTVFDLKALILKSVYSSRRNEVDLPGLHVHAGNPHPYFIAEAQTPARVPAGKAVGFFIHVVVVVL
jgi:hypothetical protein